MEFQSKRNVVLGDDGSFTLKLDYALPYQQVWLQVGRLYFGGLYIDKGLQIELDAQRLKAAQGVSFFGEGVNFGGEDGPLNLYLSQYLIGRSPDQQRLIMQRMVLAMQPGKDPDGMTPEFMRLTDSLDAIQSAYITGHPSAYSTFLRNESQSETYQLLCQAYWGKTMPDSLWKAINRHKSWCTSNNGMLFYDDLTTYIQSCQGPQRQSIKLTLQRIDSLYPPAKADFLKLRLGSPFEIDSQSTALHAIAASLHTPWCAMVIAAEARRIDGNIAEINKALAASKIPGGSTALGRPLLTSGFGATLYKVDHLSAAALLTRIAKSFPGKAIILDRWATWCGPCIEEMPYSKQLQQDAAGLPVTFVYLCTQKGASEEKWKISVFNLQQPGIHIFIDEKLDAELSAYFSFAGYPGYAFIGRDGKYRPGAITRITEISDRKALESLLAR